MTELNPIATEVVFENEEVRIWNQVVPKGASIPRHEHHHDYCLINIAGEGPLEIQFHNGSGGVLGDSLSFSPKPGTADLIMKGHIETAVNRGDEYRAILVELKNT